MLGPNKPSNWCTSKLGKRLVMIKYFKWTSRRFYSFDYSFDHSFDQTRRSSLGSFIFFKIRFLSRSSNNIFISFIVSLTKAKKKGLELKTGLVKEVNWTINITIDKCLQLIFWWKKVYTTIWFVCEIDPRVRGQLCLHVRILCGKYEE